jgi:hypothetical protein
LVRLGLVWFGLVWFGLVGSTVANICLVFDFILHTVYTVYACALTSVLPSLSIIGMIYCTANTKATPVSIECVGVVF